MRDGTSKLAQDPPESEETRHSAQVLQFRPRQRSGDHSSAATANLPYAPPAPDGELLDDLAQYEQDQEEEDLNYPHRMLMNVIAVAVVTLLIGVGVWLADTIADMERDQDCVLQGRQNCAPIEVPLTKSGS
jgi:hypothetical protein